MKWLLAVLLLASTTTATHEFYFYNNENDFHQNVDSALYDPFDGHDVEDVTDFDNYECIRLDDYNHYANLDPYDGMDLYNARNIGKRFDDLRYEDQLAIINENPSDKWNEDDINDEEDMECWTLKDYNNYADESQSDKWDEVHFQDFDDLDTVNEIGTRRYGFIEPDDLTEFDLQNTNPLYTDYDDYYFYR